MKKILTIYKSTGKYLPFMILTPIVMVIEAIVQLQIPRYIAKIVKYLDSGLTIEIRELLILGLWLLLFSLLSLLLGCLGGIFAPIASTGFAMNLKNRLYKKIQEFSFQNIDKYHTSSLVTRMTTDINWTQMSYQMSIRIMFRAPAIFIYALIKAIELTTDSTITTVFLIAIPVIVIGLAIIFMLAHPLFEKGIKQIDNLNEVVEENVRGIRVVKSFTREKDEITKFEKSINSIYVTFSKAFRVVSFNGPLMNLAINAVLIFMAYFGALMIAKSGGNPDGFDTAKLYELISYATQTLMGLMMLSMIFSFFIISKPSRDRIYEILMEEPTIKNKENPIYDVKDGSVEFKNVFFKYNENSEKYVLNNINIKIESGETIGILGSTGSSKTSLVSMIARLYDVGSGEVLVGGVNVKDYDIKSLRDSVSIVLQKNVLFSGTIRENLKWGDSDLTDEEMINASKLAQAHEFITELEEGYDTHIEQGGKNVSGGQKQRICIARALLKNPKILILDDSMSAVDTKTDKKIREGFKKYNKDMTKIIVAQRCATVMNADKIFIINDGEIVDFGTHETLLNNSKIYKEIYYSQNKEDK